MSSEPIACKLTAEELRQGAADLLPGLVAEAQAITWLPEGFELTFAGDPGLLARIAEVIEHERRCCAFLQFALAVTAGGGPISLAVSGPPGTRTVLESLATTTSSD